MYLIFTDESGNTGKNLSDANQPVHYVGGIYIDHNYCLLVQQSVEDIAKAYFNPLSPDFEFKGSDLFSGNGFFKGFDPQTRIQICKDLVGVIKTFNLKFIVAGINKQRLEDRYPSPFHPHNLATLFFLEMFQEVLENEDTLGLVVADELKDREQEIISDFKKYKEYGTGFSDYKSVEITRIIDNIHYVTSVNSWPLQLTDVILYLNNRGRKLTSDSAKLAKVKGDVSKLDQSDRVTLSFYAELLKHQTKIKIFP